MVAGVIVSHAGEKLVSRSNRRTRQGGSWRLSGKAGNVFDELLTKIHANSTPLWVLFDSLLAPRLGWAIYGG